MHRVRAVLSTVPSFVNSSGYDYFWGTSMAAPHVTGVAALAWSLAPDATYQQIKDAILDGVDPIPSLSGITVTGGRLNALNTLQQLAILVTSSDPAVDSVVSAPPTQYVVNFSQPYDPASIQTSDFTVNGLPAQAFALTDLDTVTFTFTTSPVTTQGLQTMAIAPDAIAVDPNSSALQEPFPGFTGHFRYDAVPLEIVSTVPPLLGGKFTLPGPFTYDVTFNEAVDPSSVQTSDLSLSGLPGATVSGVTVLTGDKAARFTIGGITAEGTLHVTSAAGAFTDQYGNPSKAFSARLRRGRQHIAVPDPAHSHPAAGIAHLRSHPVGNYRDGGRHRQLHPFCGRRADDHTPAHHRCLP